MAKSPIKDPFSRRENAAILRRVRKLARSGQCERAARHLKMLSHRVKASTVFRVRRSIDRCWHKAR